jgi:hypothetical protein
MLIFDEQAHTYRHSKTNEIYISTTTLLSRYKEAFDLEKNAARVAHREGVAIQDIKDKWKKNNNESKEFGTRIHKIIEDYNKNGVYDKNDTEQAAIVKSLNSLGLFKNCDDCLYEHKLFCHEYKVAGTADVIKNEDRGLFSLYDFKTNKKFNLTSIYGKFLKPPVQHLTDCEYNIYSLQVSIYAFMYANMTGLKPSQFGVIYYDRDERDFTLYPIPYLKSEAKKILDNYRQQDAYREIKNEVDKLLV